MRRAQTLALAHRKYGKVVRVGPNELSFSNPAIYREIYGKNKHIIKHPGFYESTTLITRDPSIFSTSNVARHASRRHLESRAFAHSSMMEIVDRISSKSLQLMIALQKLGEARENADAFAWFHMFAFEIICK